MNSITIATSQYFANIPDRFRKRKLLVWSIFIVLTIIMFIGAGRIKSDTAIESWFDKNDPTFIAYNKYHAQFGSEDGIFIAYKSKDGNVFSEKSLQIVKAIQDELLYYRTKLNDSKSPLDHIVRVRTLINTKVLTVEGDILYSRPLVGDVVPDSQAELEEIRKTAESQKSLPLQFFSKDFRYGGIVIDTDFGAIPVDYEAQSVEEMEEEDIVIDDMSLEDDYTSAEEDIPEFKPTDSRDYLALNAAINAIINKPEYASHLQYYMVGNTAESKYQQQSQQELGILYLAALLIMMGLLWSLFRSLSAVVWAILIVILTIIWTLGISGFLGLAVTPFIILTAFLLLTIGMADAVHVMSGYLFFRNAGQNHETAARSAFAKVSVPCLLTSVTTLIGFSSLCFSYIVPVKIVGLMGVIGVAIAFILSMYFLPVMLELWSPIAKIDKPRKISFAFAGKFFPDLARILQKILDKIAPAVEKQPARYIVLFFVVLVLCLYGTSGSKVDSNILSLYSEESEYLESIRVIDEKMSGSSSVSLFMDFGKDYALQDPYVIKHIAELQKNFENKYKKYVVTTSSLADVIKDTYQKLNQGAEEMYIIPSSRDKLAHTLYMFNNADPDERRRLVDDSYRKAAVTITLINGSSYEYNDVFDSMKKDIYAMLESIKTQYPQATISVTGTFALSMKVSEYLTMTALQSFGIAFIVINILLFFIFGSFKAGLISFIPNLMPSIFVVGLMGILAIPMDFFAIMLAPVIIGISVDDTIHFLSHYRMQYLLKEDIQQAIKNTIKEVGQGVTFTTIVVGLGFSILILSSTPGAVKLGTFGPLAVLVGLMNDLFLLPALIMAFKLRFKKSEVKQSLKLREEI